MSKDFSFIDMEEVDFSDVLDGAGSLNLGDKNTLFSGRLTPEIASELVIKSGIAEALRAKGYKKFTISLEHNDEKDERIFIRAGNEVLVHIRLKLSHFKFHRHSDLPALKMLFIDWLLTRHPHGKYKEGKLFPGQDAPGLGIFSQIGDLIRRIASITGALGAFNMPEYFHDALLFHREFHFYDPEKEAFFRCLIRDLRSEGARKISSALAEGRVMNQSKEMVQWHGGEMISFLHEEKERQVFNRIYHTQVIQFMKKMRFHFAPA